MRSLEFKRMFAKNFLCFGPDGIEICFENYGNIVFINGENLDVFDSEDEEVSRNGVGKSSVFEIMVYSLFGKTIKHPKKISHADVINNKVKKGLVTEFCWDRYRVVRTRGPNSLRFWDNESCFWDLHVKCSESGELIQVPKKQDGVTTSSVCDFSYKKEDVIDPECTLGSIKETQNLIIEKLGLTYEAFINLVIFTDNNAGSFLELDAADKRKVVENLLGLDKYKEYHDAAKAYRNKAKDRIKTISLEYNHIVSSVNNSNLRIDQILHQEKTWKDTKRNEIGALKERLAFIKTQLKETDLGAKIATYNKAQEDIEAVNKKMKSALESQDKIKVILQEVFTKKQQLQLSLHEAKLGKNKSEFELQNIKSEIAKQEKLIKELETKEGTKCLSCFGTVKKANYEHVVNHALHAIEGLKIKEANTTKFISAVDGEVSEIDEQLNKIAQATIYGDNKMQAVMKELNTYRTQIANLSKVNKPVAKAQEQIIESKIEDIKSQIISKQDELDNQMPYADLIEEAKAESKLLQKQMDSKSVELKEAEEDLPYYDFWVQAFSDTGIRKFVIDGIIPTLNSQVSKWLETLIYGKMSLKFDSELKETITRNPPDGNPFVYWIKSGGEKRRLNLATMVAWAHVAMLNAGVLPSAILLDEVSANIDTIGIIAVYDMIQELSKDRQVFVTTHDRDLIELLSHYDVLKLQKKNSITRLISN